MVTKPCARASDGCQGLAIASCPSRLAKRKFCSSRCAALYYVERGTHVLQTISVAQRRAAGRRGGKLGGEKRRKVAVQAAAQRCKSLMPAALRAKLTEREQAVLLLLFVRAWESGHVVGMSTERTRRLRVDAAKAQGVKVPRRQAGLDQARRDAA
jgi:hypothetical protein